MKLSLILLALLLSGCHKPDDPCSAVAVLAEDRLKQIGELTAQNSALAYDKQALEKRVAELEAAQPKPEARLSVGQRFEEYVRAADRYASNQ